MWVRSCGVTSASRSSIMPRRKRVSVVRCDIASAARACAASSRIACARRCMISPAGVRRMGRALRCKSVAPTAPSRLVNCWLTAEGLAPSRRAAAEIDRSSAAAMNTSIPQSVIRPLFSTIALLVELRELVLQLGELLADRVEIVTRLLGPCAVAGLVTGRARSGAAQPAESAGHRLHKGLLLRAHRLHPGQIGRASCRERVCQYV